MQPELRERDLTPRQCAILNEVARGHENKVIAQDLGVSEETVRTQLKRAFRKLGVGSRSDAARRHHRLKTWKGHVCGRPNGPDARDDEPIEDLSPDEDEDG